MYKPIIYKAKRLNSNEYVTGTVLKEPRGNWTMYWLENSGDVVKGLEGKFMNYADIDPNTIEIIGPTVIPEKTFQCADNICVGCFTLSNTFIYRCVDCGYLLKRDYDFCPKCGKKIDWRALDA